MKQLRIGVIGAWGRGRIAAHAHNLENNSIVVAGSDVYQDSLDQFVKSFQEQFNHTPATYLDYREMIEKENLDGVIIASPDFLHEEHAIYALNHKVAVYLEKPIAITIEGADRILQAAYDNKTRLVCGHNMRYMTFTRKMKEIIDSGMIGEVKTIWCRHFINYGGDAYYRDWHADRDLSTGLLLQKAAHDIDIIHWLAGGVSDLVHGMGNLTVYDKVPRRPIGQERLDKGTDPKSHEIWWSDTHWPPLAQKNYYPTVNVEDLSMMNMRLNNGVLACYQQCHYTPDTVRNYTVIGTKGRLENFGDCGETSRVEVWTERQPYRDYGNATFRTPPSKGSHGGADPLIIKSFVDALQGKYDVWSTPQAARYSVAAGCKATESIRDNGSGQAVPALPKHLENFDFTTLEEK